MNHPKNSPEPNDYVSYSLEVTIKVGLVIGLVVWCFLIIKPFMMIALWSIILAVATFPMFNGLKKTLWNRGILASITVTVLLLIAILLPVILLGGSMGQAITYIRDSLTSGTPMIPPPDPSVKEWPVIGEKLYHAWHTASVNLGEFAVEYRDQIMKGLTFFLTALTNAGMGLLIILASIIVSGVLLVYADQGGQAVRRVAVRLMGQKGIEVVSNAEVTVRNVARGILGVAFIQAFLSGIGFLVAGIPGAGFWALISFFLAIIQIGVGPVVIGVLIYAWIKLSFLTALLLTIYCILPLTVDNILKPILLGRKAPAPMIVVFLGAIGGFLSFGTIGLFVGAVVLSLGYYLFLLWLDDAEGSEVNITKTDHHESL